MPNPKFVSVIRSILFLGSLLIPLNLSAFQSVTLAWDANTETNLAGYRMYYGIASGDYSASIDVPVPATSGKINGLIEGLKYYFAVTAYNTDGIESDFSSEVQYLVPGLQVKLPPIAPGTAVSTAQNTPVDILLPGTDPQDQPLNFILQSSPANGTLAGKGAYFTYTPKSGFYGTDTFTYTVSAGGLLSAVATVKVTVQRSNTPPLLSAIGNMLLRQNAGTQSVPLTGISAGANESQSLTITAASDNVKLVPKVSVSYTSPNSTGALSFTPLSNVSGTARITVTVSDGQAENSTATQTFTVMVNNPPTLNDLPNLSVNENAAAQTVALSGIGAGALGENQALTITASSSNPALIPAPAISYSNPNSTGTLTFKPTANASASAVITITVNDGQTGNNTISKSFAVTVNSQNIPPTLNGLPSMVLAQNAAATAVALSGISSGSASENQTLTVTASSSAPSLLPNPSVSYASPASTGTLTLKPSANAWGTATVIATVNDGQSLNNTISRTFAVLINNPPTLNALANVSLVQNSAAVNVSLAGITSGAANESQALSIGVSSSNPSVVPAPQLSYASPASTGTLIIKPAVNATGSSVITVTVNDGQAGNNTISRSFAVTVSPVNTPPTLAASANLIIGQNAGTQRVPLAGISSGAAAEVQTLKVTATSSNPALIPTPVISYTSPSSTGWLTFAPASNQSGTATITVSVDDGQASNNVVSRSFWVLVNNPPTLSSLPDLTVQQDSAAKSISLTGIGAGGAGESQTLSVTAASSNPALIPAPSISYSSPGSTGTLTLKPKTGATGTAVITVTVGDGQAGNNSTSDSFTVTVVPAAPVVSNLIVSASDARSLTVSWNTDKPASCMIEYGATPSLGSQINLLSGTSHAAFLTGLTPGTPYYIRVTATGSNGSFSQTDVSVASTPFVNVVDWSAESGSPVKPMLILSDSGAEGGKYISSTVANSGSAVFNVQLPEGMTYAFWARSKVGVGGGGFGVSVDGGPETLVTIPADSAGAWRWTPLQSSTGPLTFLAESGAHQIKFRVTTPNTMLDELAVSNDPEWAPLNPFRAPDLSATPASATSVDLAWSDPANNADSYVIESSANGKIFATVASVPGSSRSYTVLDASLTSHYYRVYAANSVDRSANSYLMSAIPQANQLPLAPRTVSAKVIKSSLVSIGWTDASSSENGFSIERSTDGVNFTQVRTMGANATGASDIPPTPGLYYYQVRAFNAAGTSEAAEMTAVLY
jgi:hypothetical protein